jgi:hypothetical protein
MSLITRQFGPSPKGSILSQTGPTRPATPSIIVTVDKISSLIQI